MLLLALRKRVGNKIKETEEQYQETNHFILCFLLLLQYQNIKLKILGGANNQWIIM